MEPISLPNRPFKVVQWMGLLALALIVLLIGIVGYYVHFAKYMMQQQAQSNNLLHYVAKQTEAQQVSIHNLQQQVAHDEKLIAHDRERIFLNQQVQALYLAALHLEMYRDPQFVLNRLQQVKQQLELEDKEKYASLLKAIYEKEMQLRLAAKINVVEIVTQLEALKSLIPNLPLQIQSAKEKSQKTTDKANSLSQWRDTIAQNLTTLKMLITIRRENEVVKPLLAPEQRLYVEQNLSLLIDQAKWAALQLENSLYQQSLQSIEALINRYFLKDDANVQKFVQEIHHFAGQNVTMKVPDLMPLVSQFKQFDQQRRG